MGKGSRLSAFPILFCTFPIPDHLFACSSLCLFARSCFRLILVVSLWSLVFGQQSISKVYYLYKNNFHEHLNSFLDIDDQRPFFSLPAARRGKMKQETSRPIPFKAEITRILDYWHNAASRADMPAYFGMIDEEGIYIGTDATENWTKQAFYDWSKPYFDKGKAWSFHAEERKIYLLEDLKMAWFDEKLSSASGPLRGSGVLINRNGQWKILHYVLSLPVPNERFKEVIELINEE